MFHFIAERLYPKKMYHGTRLNLISTFKFDQQMFKFDQQMSMAHEHLRSNLHANLTRACTNGTGLKSTFKFDQSVKIDV